MGAIIGFAFKQRWPDSLGRMSEWPARAAEKADVQDLLAEHVERYWALKQVYDLLRKQR